MAFIVEDGTGKADANAYVSVAFVTAYLTETGNESAWSALGSTLQEQAIVRASRYIDQRFARRFMSTKRLRTQALQWPRYDIYDASGQLWVSSDEVPAEVQKATAEYAQRASVGASELITDPSSSRTPMESKKKIGPIEKTEKFGSSNGTSGLVPAAAFSAYPTADLWIEPLLTGRQGSPLAKV